MLVFRLSAPRIMSGLSEVSYKEIPLKNPAELVGFL